MSEHRPPLRSFGRLQARALKPRQAALMETLLPRLAVPPSGPISPRGLFPGVGSWGMEIGFGGGEHLAAQAASRPDWGVLGAEPFVNGVAKCLVHVEDAGVADRVRLHHGDVRDLLPRIPDASLDRVWILFPDPWPKTRHHKRRLIQTDFLGEIVRILKPGAELRFATDWMDYAAWTLERALRTPRLDWPAQSAADWRDPWPDHVTTRYEQKRLGDTPPIFLRFVRND